MKCKRFGTVGRVYCSVERRREKPNDLQNVCLFLFHCVLQMHWSSFFCQWHDLIFCFNYVLYNLEYTKTAECTASYTGSTYTVVRRAVPQQSTRATSFLLGTIVAFALRENVREHSKRERTGATAVGIEFLLLTVPVGNFVLLAVLSNLWTIDTLSNPVKHFFIDRLSLLFIHNTSMKILTLWLNNTLERSCSLLFQCSTISCCKANTINTIFRRLRDEYSTRLCLSFDKLQVLATNVVFGIGKRRPVSKCCCVCS